jgi:signal transduction histidine kinase
VLLWYIFIFFVIGLFIFVIFQYISKGRGLLKKLNESENNYRDLAKKYEAAKTTKQDLETRIQEEVAKNREKDYVLIQQSSLAAMMEMIASMDHQWRQPLNNLSLLIQDVREALEFGEIDDQYIERFTKEGMFQIKEMSQTIDDFRRFYKPNKEKTPFPVGDSIEAALSIFSTSLKKHGIQVEFEYRGQYTAFGFPNEFCQAVLNLLTNTRDAFVQNKTDNRKIFINIVETDNEITVEFIDNAGGFERELHEKIFDPYFTKRQHGTGIGLYLTKKILENMDGRVSVDNSGDGARFCLTVPKAAAAVQPDLISVSSSS